MYSKITQLSAIKIRMSINIKHIFKTSAKAGAILATSLTLLANASLAREKTAQDFLSEETAKKELLSQETYWKYKDYGIIIKSTPCKKRGLCISVYNFDPNNPKAQKFYDKLNKMMKVEDWGTIHKDYTGEKGIKKLCQFEFNSNLERYNDGSWDGENSNSNKDDFIRNVGIYVKPLDQKTVKLTAYLGIRIIGFSMTGNLVENTPEACNFKTPKATTSQHSLPAPK